MENYIPEDPKENSLSLERSGDSEPPMTFSTQKTIFGFLILLTLSMVLHKVSGSKSPV